MRSASRVGGGLSAILCALALASGLHAESRIDGFRSAVEKWVETRQILSAEQAEWEAERETLKVSRDLLAQQKESLETEIRELEASNTRADEERRDLLLERGAFQRASGTLASEIRAMEQELLALVPQLPEPLQKKLEVLLVQIPEDPETTKLGLGQRLMSVLGVLAQAEKWNGTATFVGETRAVRGDQKVQIRTLYWGLGQAIYVDAMGEVAGIGRPSADGWEFTEMPGLEDDARLLLDIYEGNVDSIEFVSLPVEIQ